MEKVMGQLHTIQGTFQRPNDTAIYTSGDVVTTNTAAGSAAIIQFPNASRDASTIAGSAGQGMSPGLIVSAILVSSANKVALKLEAELWLFDTAITMDGDNAVFTPTDAELQTLVGVIPFPAASWRVGDATADAGGNAICEVDNLAIPFNAVNGNVLYGVLVARNGYTPVGQEIFFFRLKSLD